MTITANQLEKVNAVEGQKVEFKTSAFHLECDPYTIPPGFLATTIAIHLGKRIG